MSAAPIRPKAIVTDDYERWYTEQAPNNRMLLAIRSGIQTEMNWAFDRLCRLCDNEAWGLSTIPGLIDTLFDWPERFVNDAIRSRDDANTLFRPSNVDEATQRHALLSMLVLRNSTLNTPNAAALAAHKRTRALVYSALQHVKPSSAANSEFLLYTLELFSIINSTPSMPVLHFSSEPNPITYMAAIAKESSDRALIIASFSALALIFSEPANYRYLHDDSPALVAAIRFLPVFSLKDRVLTEACLNYLSAHLSYPPMTKAFLRHPEMPNTLRLLVSIILSEQVVDLASLEIPDSSAPPTPRDTPKLWELKPAEVARLAEMMEPQRSEEWMSLMFSSSNDGELTQVEFFSLYRDTFTGVGDDAHPLMAAADLIKAVPRVFPNASATVVPGPPTRFVVRGIERRKEERLLCRWGRGACDASPFDAPSHLVAHVLVHAQAQGHGPCEWATCAHPGGPHLATHVRTHLPIELPPDTASLGGARIVMRAPAVRDRAGGHDAATIKYPKPVADAPSATLAALLCIRVLFHHAYAVVERAPRADEDRFGFPGVVEDDDAEEVTAVQDAAEREGAQRGQRAFARIRGMLENVVLKEDVLMGWIAEILDAGDTDDLQI